MGREGAVVGDYGGGGRWLERQGVDAIIAQGSEAGDHRGMFLTDDLTTQTGTFALLPQVVRAVRVPVIAAGGIADADGVAAPDFPLAAIAIAALRSKCESLGSDDFSPLRSGQNPLACSEVPAGERTRQLAGLAA